jgi:3-oxoacyl-[acyl-carrier protein] reductase
MSPGRFDQAPGGPVTLITGSRKGIGRYLAEHYTAQGHTVIGCSRGPSEYSHPAYSHFELDITDEAQVTGMFAKLRKVHGGLDHLINNAGIASMNHSLLTPMKVVQTVLQTNVSGTFLFCREAAKLMQRRNAGRIVNFVTVAVPLNLEGEAIYAASKAAVASLTKVLAREFGGYRITVNAVGPTPIRTDLIRGVPESKLEALIERQAIRRFGELQDVSNVIDFFLSPRSDFITGQIIYLGGV